LSLLSALLLTGAAASGAAAEAYPAEAVLENFAQTCGDLTSLAAADAAARKAGWEVYDPPKDAPVRQLLDFGMSAAKKFVSDDPHFKTDARIMRISFGDHKFDLMLTAVQQIGSFSLGCRMVDFAAAEPIADTVIDAWLVGHFKDAPKGESAKVDDLIQMRGWQPGLFADHHKTQIAFVPQQSPLKSSLHLSGINLMSQTRN
jgi:hypothetical protein